MIPEFKPFTKRLLFAVLVDVAVVVVFKVRGTLRNHDDDGNGNVKKNNGLNEQNNSSARASHFLVHFFAFTAQLQREMTKF